MHDVCIDFHSASIKSLYSQASQAMNIQMIFILNCALQTSIGFDIEVHNKSDPLSNKHFDSCWYKVA